MNFVDFWKNKYLNIKYIVIVIKFKFYISFKILNMYDIFSFYV